MEHSFFGKYGNIELRPLTIDDIENLRVWRNDQSSTRFLRPIGYIDEKMQKQWFVDYLVDKDIYTFSIFEKTKLNRMIGSLAIYNFRGKKAEIGKIQIGDPEAHGMGIGKKALVIAMKIGFELMGIHIFDGSVHQDNIPAHKNDISIGFKIVGTKQSAVGGLEDIIEIDYESLKKANEYVEKIEVCEK